MEQFFQKAIFIKKKFTFKEKGVNIDFTDKNGDFSMFIRYDRISSKENVRVNTRRKALVWRFGLLAAFLTLTRGFLTATTDAKTTVTVVCVALFIAAATYAYYYFTQVKYYAVKLNDDKVFMVLYNKPTIEEAKRFIDELFERRKQYYRDRYFNIDYENDKRTELDWMKWLRSENIITESEFDVVVEEINENIEN